jgi:hypothetical protein
MIQNGGGSADIWTVWVNTEVALEMWECMKFKDSGDVNLQLSLQHD